MGDCLGPPIANTDMGVYKTFKATERVSVQFRMDFFNLFNHPQFGSPGGNAAGAEGNAVANLAITFGAGSAATSYNATTHTLSVSVTQASGAATEQNILDAINGGNWLGDIGRWIVRRLQGNGDQRRPTNQP